MSRILDFLLVSLRTGCEACVSLGCNGLFIGAEEAWRGWIKPGQVAAISFYALDLILPRASVIIHHGGVGTAAAAMRHSVGQVIVPRIFSQFENAETLRRLGIASVLKPEALTRDSLVIEIENAVCPADKAGNGSSTIPRFEEFDKLAFFDYIEQTVSRMGV